MPTGSLWDLVCGSNILENAVEFEIWVRPGGGERTSTALADPVQSFEAFVPKKTVSAFRRRIAAAGSQFQTTGSAPIEPLDHLIFP